MLVNQIKKYVSIVKIFAAMITVISIGYLINVNSSLRRQTRILTNNAEAYKDMLNTAQTEKHALRLKLGDLSASNDKLVQTVDSTRRVLKIKDKELKMAMITNTVIDTVKTDSVYLASSCNFSDTIQFNDETESYIELKDSVLTNRIHVENQQQLFVYTKREYLRKYKNFLTRLVHLDFKKYESTRYQIINSNDLIETKETRVIQMEE